ncbi:MAG: nucleotidyltransferase family protein [Candidatus Eiseniibacteriota bacterium]
MIAGVLLAGGASRRMGRDKALLRAGADSYLVRGVRVLWSACDSVVVVLGANAPNLQRAAEAEFGELVARGRLDTDLHAARRHGASGLEARFVRNPKWRAGMLSSARIGLRAALSLQPAAVLVLPVDHPAVDAATVAGLTQVLLGAMAACRPRELKKFRYALIPRHLGRRGHPLALTPALAHDVAADARASDLSDAVRRSARLVGYLDVPDAGVVFNHNTLRDRRPLSARGTRARRRAARA